MTVIATLSTAKTVTIMDKFKVASLAALIGLVGCEGAVSGGDGDPTPTPTASPTATVSATPTPTQQAQAASTLYLQGTASETIAGDTPIADASVTVTVSDVDSDGASRIRKFYTTTDDNGDYLVSLEDVVVEADGAYVEVVATKSGSTDGIRRVTSFSSEGSQTINADLIMSSESVAVVSVAETDVELGTAAAAAGLGPRVRFRMYQGSEDSPARVFIGDQYDEAAAAAGENPDVDVILPVSSLSSDINAVVAGIQGFTPTDPDQVQNFPGEFVGNGDPSSTDVGVSFGDGTGDDQYRLISSGFAQIRLEDQDGNTLALAEGASASADGDPKIYLELDSSVYTTIIEDRNPQVSGIQVPIFIYRDGWEFAGNGTLVVPDDNDGYTDYDGSIADLQGDSAPESLYAGLDITEGNEWIKWVNLDWPIQTEGVATVDFCFDGSLNYAATAGQDAQPYNGYLNIQTPDSGNLNAYVANGVISVPQQSMVSTGFDADISSWTFRAVNRLIGRFVTLTPANESLQVVTDGTCTDLGSFTLSNPLQCLVQGSVSKQGAATADQLVEVSTDSGYRTRVLTNDSGEYSAQIPCDVALTVRASGNPAAETRTADLVTSAAPVEVDISFDNLPPIIAGVFGPTFVQIGESGSETADFQFTAYDLDSESVAVQSWTCSQAAAELEAAAAPAFSFVEGVQTCNVDAAGEWNWTLVVADDLGATATQSGSFDAEALNANKAPRVELVLRNGAPLKCDRSSDGLACEDELPVNASGAAIYQVIAFDPNGDSLAYSWQSGETEVGTSAAYSNTFAPTEGEQVIDLTVSDDNDAPASREVSITITKASDIPPVFEALFIEPMPVPVFDAGSGPSNAQSLTVIAFILDDDSNLDVTATLTVGETSNALAITWDDEVEAFIATIEQGALAESTETSQNVVEVTVAADGDEPQLVRRFTIPVTTSAAGGETGGSTITIQ